MIHAAIPADRIVEAYTPPSEGADPESIVKVAAVNQAGTFQFKMSTYEQVHKMSVQPAL